MRSDRYGWARRLGGFLRLGMVWLRAVAARLAGWCRRAAGPASASGSGALRGRPSAPAALGPGPSLAARAEAEGDGAPGRKSPASCARTASADAAPAAGVVTGPKPLPIRDAARQRPDPTPAADRGAAFCAPRGKGDAAPSMTVLRARPVPFVPRREAEARGTLGLRLGLRGGGADRKSVV